MRPAMRGISLDVPLQAVITTSSKPRRTQWLSSFAVDLVWRTIAWSARASGTQGLAARWLSKVTNLKRRSSKISQIRKDLRDVRTVRRWSISSLDVIGCSAGVGSLTVSPVFELTSSILTISGFELKSKKKLKQFSQQKCECIREQKEKGRKLRDKSNMKLQPEVLTVCGSSMKDKDGKKKETGRCSNQSHFPNILSLRNLWS